MKTRQIVTLVLVGWCLLMWPETKRCIADGAGVAEAPNYAPENDQAYLKAEEAKLQAVIDTDPEIQRIRKLKHVTNVSAEGTGCDATGCGYAISVQVNYPRDLDTVERQVPSNIGGYPVEFNVLHDPNNRLE